MKTQKVNKNKVVKSIVKILADKKAVRSYIKGETTLTALSQKGIKLANPL